jgi:hypothetical protein
MNSNRHGGETTASVTDDGGRRRRGLWKVPAAITALLLAIPLLRDLFVNGWNWDVRGFVVVASVGTLLFSIGLTCQMLIRRLGTPAYRVAVGLTLVTAFVLVWGNFVQAADDVNPDAMMYLWVPLVGIIAAAVARFRPDGMARALFLTALAQALALAIGLTVRDPQATPWTAAALRGFGGNAFFAVLFVGAALLFRKAGTGEAGRAAG